MEIQQLRNQINQELSQLKFSDNPPELYEPIRYILTIGGKRMRPLLTLLGCYLYSDDYQKAMKPALVTEVFHNFTLMHDDLMDGSPKRRGKPTVHEKWSSDIAILSGDAMLVEAYNLLLDISPELLPKILKLFNRCALEVCEGQQFDMNFEQLEEVSEEAYTNMIRLKTSVLLGFAIQLGALIGGASDTDADALREFGVSIGIGFQLKDDLLDVFGDPDKFGKRVGMDIIANKKTYLLITALKEAEGALKDNLEHWISLKEFDMDEKVAAVKSIYQQLHIQEKTEKLMNEYFDQGFNALERIHADEVKKGFLRSFTEQLLHRER
ncbi:MAG: polyprenyl synthetase family protein [Flammeovirgaceae bacterium]